MENEYTSSTKTSQRISRDGLSNLTQNSVDPKPFGRVTRDGMNMDLTDVELVGTIEERNSLNKPTYLLRLEYERRLRQRGLW